MNVSKERNYGIDLARLFFMFLICLHHAISQGGIFANDFVGNQTIYSVIYAITMIGVDGFAIISGYVAQNKNQRYEKIISMWLQVFFYSFGIPFAINVLHLISGTNTFDFLEIIKGMFPVLNHNYWYFDAYIVLFFFMPIINEALMDLDEQKSKKTLVVLFILMIIMWKNNEASCHNFLNSGKSAFWLIILYCVGLLIKKTKILYKVNSWLLLLISCLFIFISLKYANGSPLSMEDSEPVIWGAALLMVIVFSRFEPNKKIVSLLSPLSFGVYLFHENYYFRYYFLSERYLMSENLLTIKGFFGVIGFSLITFVTGLLIDYVRKKCFEFLNIDLFAKKIVVKINDLLDKSLQI